MGLVRVRMLCQTPGIVAWLPCSEHEQALVLGRQGVGQATTDFGRRLGDGWAMVGTASGDGQRGRSMQFEGWLELYG